MTQIKKLIDTWNGGKGGERVVFIGTDNECFEWVLKHTPFSFHEATTQQGYMLQPANMTRIDTIRY